MTEIEKMFENVGIKCLHPSGFCKHIGATCEVCERHKYPPFTAEKQIELIKWLSKRRLLNITFCENKNTYQLSNNKCTGGFCSDLATAVVSLVQCELDFCTEEEKEEIRRMLNDR